ncbi:PREDICTED: deleted in autism protein 1 [Pygoscelis adeliae]|uniref:deleted in autism protein 1 n=1 Tax=Pygoscelis adeliae TaxID=9238 RepID=UPI0004F4DB8D|nr:PREDICTED: deleted in autism protein 1 [Pygoscelis adeliae]
MFTSFTRLFRNSNPLTYKSSPQEARATQRAANRAGKQGVACQKGVARQFTQAGRAGKTSGQGAVPLLALEANSTGSHRPPRRGPAMVSTRLKAVTRRNVATQTKPSRKQAAVQVSGCRECLSLSAVAEGGRDDTCVRCDQVDDLLGLVVELKEEATQKDAPNIQGRTRRIANVKPSFPSDEGWPFAKYLGACGRMVAVNYVGEELWSYFNAPWEKRVDLAWQLMEIAEQLTNNDFEFALYLLDVSFDNFAVGPRDGKVIIVDAENVLVADKRLIRQNKPENWDVWYESKFDDCDKEACLSFSKEILCARVTVDHNYYAVCQNLLSRHATWRGTSGGLLHDPPAEIAKDGRLEALLDECANPKKRYGRFQAAKELREYLAQLSNNVR